MLNFRNIDFGILNYCNHH